MSFKNTNSRQSRQQVNPLLSYKNNWWTLKVMHLFFSLVSVQNSADFFTILSVQKKSQYHWWMAKSKTNVMDCWERKLKKQKASSCSLHTAFLQNTRITHTSIPTTCCVFSLQFQNITVCEMFSIIFKFCMNAHRNTTYYTIQCCKSFFANWQSFLKLVQDIFDITFWRELSQLWTTTGVEWTLPTSFS